MGVVGLQYVHYVCMGIYFEYALHIEKIYLTQIDCTQSISLKFD